MPLYNTGGYGIHPYNVDTYVSDDVTLPLKAVHEHPDSTIRQFLLFIHTLYDHRYQKAIDIEDATHLTTSSGGSLGNIATLANISRNTNEDDEQFRHRIRAKLTSGSTETTFDDTLSFLSTMLDVPESEIKVSLESNDPGTLYIHIPNDVIESNELSASEIGDLADEVVPAGANASVQTIGTFEFDGDGYTPSSGSGFNEGAFGEVL